MKKNKVIAICLAIVFVISSVCLYIGLQSIDMSKQIHNSNETNSKSNQEWQQNLGNSTTSKKTTTVTTTTAKIETKDEYIKKCKKYTYKEIARNPDDYYFKYAKFTGKVVQTLYDGNYVQLRVDVTKDKYGYYDDTIYVVYTKKAGESKILEDDIVTIYGMLAGETSYESVLHTTITLPLMYAEYIDIK